MLRPLLLSAILLLPALPSAARAAGETLLLSMPLPESGWTVRNAVSPEEEIVEWLRADSGDAAAARILRNRGGLPPAEYRQAVDSEALGTCSPYGSREVSANDTGPYPHSLWIARCTLDLSRSLTVLHLYISGRDHGYYLTRKWRGTPPDAVLGEWVDYFTAVGLCDSRPERGVPCPEGGD